MWEELQDDAPDAVIARLAVAQHGVVSVDQLEAVGVGRSLRNRRVGEQRLHRIHRGVYAVGHRGLSERGIWMAAVLAYRPHGVLSHFSAAALWNLLPSPSLSHVTVPGNGGRRHRKGIRVHHALVLGSRDVARRQGIPVTSPARTLADLRRAGPARTYARALRQAEYLKLPIGERRQPDHTRSELETRFLGILRRHRLPSPQVNVRVAGHLVDFVWPEAKLVVELDGYRAHGGRSAFEADRRRDVALKLRGYEVIRLTWRQIVDEPRAAADLVRRLLRRHQLRMGV